MFPLSAWSKKDLWHIRSKAFAIEISLTHGVTSPEKGPYRWNVYAYIYPTHPHFAKFTDEEVWQEAATALPLHGGATFLRWFCGQNGEPHCIQVGSDYAHAWDDEFSFFSSPEEASQVFADAEELFHWLENYDLDVDVPAED